MCQLIYLRLFFYLLLQQLLVKHTACMLHANGGFDTPDLWGKEHKARHELREDWKTARETVMALSSPLMVLNISAR